MKAMEVFDKTIESLTKHGVMVVLNNHIGDAMWCCSTTDENGLWYNPRYSEQMWIDALVSLHKTYKNNPLVVANDLRNELRYDNKMNVDPKWGSGNPADDWYLAAQKAGNAILAEDPDMLIIVEGLNYANDMTPIRSKPMKLDVDNRLIYSFHLYSW